MPCIFNHIQLHIVNKNIKYKYYADRLIIVITKLNTYNKKQIYIYILTKTTS